MIFKPRFQAGLFVVSYPDFSQSGIAASLATMRLTRMILPVLALAFAFGTAQAEEKKASLAYYYIDG